VTGVAAVYDAFPGWLAVIEHMPGSSTEKSVLPKGAQMERLFEVSVTGRPELAVAPMGKAKTPSILSLNGPKLIVWLTGSTVKLCVTVAAAAYVALPAWPATIMHVPPETIVTVLPATVQTSGVMEAKVTARPELAVALIAYGATP
jgi:hypothetical protein